MVLFQKSVVDLFLVSSFPMSVTTHSDCCLHLNYLSDRSYCRHIHHPPSPRKHDSGLVLCIGDDAFDGDRCCGDTAPLSLLLVVGGPSVKKFPGSIIRHRRADSFKRWEHPWDLVSTLLWPSTAILFSTPQLLCDIGIPTINSYGWTKVSGVKRNSESEAVFTGQYQPPPSLGLPFRPGGDKILQRCNDRYSGFGSVVDFYILRFLCYYSSQMSATAPLSR